ncbi:ABC transporter substrate-binding protein [Ruania alba]|uniref:ABC transporter substrate-binding protein n=1 Tax=Ruania alba TaxID=648782 RepID=UPI001587B699|nr:extracellular solute-binding protein [Ruania alba]
MGQFEIPDPAGELPTGDVELRVLGTPDSHPAFWAAFGGAYEEKHPNVTIEYEGAPHPRIREILPLAVRNGTAHDMFLMSGGLVPDAVASGWVRPLDDIIPNFDEWKAQFPEGIFVPGAHLFDGKTYSVPLSTRKLQATFLLSNTSILERAEVELSETPTWDEFRDAAKKITEVGDGEFYGFALPGVRMTNNVRRLTQTAGVGGPGDIDTQTGRHIASSDEYREAVELILAMQADGSLLPGSVSMTAQEAPPRVVTGSVGMIIDGGWMIEGWQNDSPDFEFGVSGPPRPSVDSPPTLARDPQGGYWVNAETANPEVIGDIYSYMGGLEGQIASAQVKGVTFPSLFPEAREALAAVVTGPRARAMAEHEQVVLPPYVQVRNTDALMVFEELEEPRMRTPQVLEAIMVGDVSDVGQALQDLGDGYDRALDDAIAAATAKGAEISRDEWIFPNFDPTEDYTSADYDAL